MRPVLRRARAVLILLAALGGSVFAQNTGEIVGTISDGAGQVPGATVELTNENTGVKRSSTTNEEGHYEFGNLQPGVYSVRVNKSGFKNFAATGIVLDAGGRLRRDATLTLGDVTETVTVESGTAQVDTE